MSTRLAFVVGCSLAWAVVWGIIVGEFAIPIAASALVGFASGFVVGMGSTLISYRGFLAGR